MPRLSLDIFGKPPQEQEENTAKRILVIGGTVQGLLLFRAPLLSAMQEKGWEVYACASNYHGPSIKKLLSKGIRFKSLYGQRTGTNPFADLLYFSKLVLHILSIRPDIIFSYSIKPVIYGSLAGKLCKVPNLFAMIEGLGYTFSQKGWLRKLVHLLYECSLKHNQSVFFLNPDDEAVFRELELMPAEQPSLLLNGIGVDIRSFEITTPPAEPTRFLLVARLLNEKGIVEYAEAARQIRKRYPNTQFDLVGPLDISHPQSVDPQLLDQWKRDEILEYHGCTDDVRPFLYQCSVFVLPSYYREGLPRTLLEAMAAGRAIITTDTPGCRETVRLTEMGKKQKASEAPVMEGENGLLVRPRNIPALVQAIQTLIENTQKISEMGAISCDIAEDDYDIEDINATILSHIESFQDSDHPEYDDIDFEQ